MGASAAVNLSYVGQGPTGQSQVFAGNESGPKNKTLYGYGTIVSGSDATSVTVNFVNGSTTTGAFSQVPAFVNVFRAGNSGDSATAGVLSTLQLVPSALTSTGFVINYPTVTTSGVTLSFGAVIAFSS